MGDIRKNFSCSEFEKSKTADDNGIDNHIKSEAVKEAIKELVLTCLQPVRDFVRVPIIVESGWRCLLLNKLVGGVPSSQHPKGEAADIRSPFMTPLELARAVVALHLPFDQLILYPTFVHVSHKLKGKQRGQILYNRRYTGEKI